jgi:hypothetical protein
MDYIYEVLVPEVTIRLIREDYVNTNVNMTLEKAHEIMINSIGFGEYMFNDDND